jgi:hypothetical protein
VGRKKVTRRKPVQRRTDDGEFETVYENVTEWVSDDSSSGGSDWSSDSSD